MKFGVVVFPGSNCDHDLIYVLKNIFDQEVVPLWHKDHDLQSCDFILLPGGFSYGDYLRSGAIARFSPIMEEVVKFANNGGFVMGICNGFQILCEAHLLPGVLLHNENHKFICRNSFILPQAKKSLATSQLKPDEPLKIPISHGEGRYFAQDDIIKKLNDNEQVIFRYCDKEGNITSEANPNGSVENIAGICNESGNVIGMMPHPERAADQNLYNVDGKAIFESLLRELKARITY